MIRRTAGGVPHIEARTWRGLGFGVARAFSEDNFCVIADDYVTLAGERSRFFGPDGTYATGSGRTWRNLDSDFYYARLAAVGTVERIVAAPPPNGPLPEWREIVRGYVNGYNSFIRSGRLARSAPSCASERWVRPIRAVDAWRRFYQLNVLASSGAAIAGIGTAQPPTVAALAAVEPTVAEPVSRAAIASLGEAVQPRGLGSNGVALGRDLTDNGQGMLLVNPHYQWNGTERFYQFAVSLPGRLESSGAAFFGVPIPLVGFNRRLAWTHTIASTFRFTPIQLTLLNGSPTEYVVDGAIRAMRPIPLSVVVRDGDGTERSESRTLYDTEYGPMFTSVAGQSIFPWTSTSAFAFRDANAADFRSMNHFLLTNMASSVREYDQIQRRFQGIPWSHSIAADDSGAVYYADIGSVPNVSDDHAARCNTPIGTLTFVAIGLPVLDGSRADCNWREEPDAPAPGLFPARALPSLTRSDSVTNSNDSHWLTNPKQPLAGYARIVGDESTARSLRTRMGLKLIDELATRPARTSPRVSTRDLEELIFNNRDLSAELWRDPLVRVCRASPTVTTPTGAVDVSVACEVLATWDGRENIDSRGSVIWRRFVSNLLKTSTPASYFEVPFDPANPVTTPNGLNVANPAVVQALASAVRDLTTSGIPLDAPLGDWQYEMRGSERIPLHGGPDNLGVFNVVNPPFVKGAGWPDTPHGASILMAVQFDARRRCPVRADSLLAYSESTEPGSSRFADQTRLYSQKKWLRLPFCIRDVINAPGVVTERVGRSAHLR